MTERGEWDEEDEKRRRGAKCRLVSLTQAAAVINGWDDLQNALTSKRIDSNPGTFMYIWVLQR